MAREAAVLDGYKPNFETLRDAALSGRLALLETRDARTGHLVATVVAVNRHPDGDVEFVPLAAMLDADPYQYLEPPAPAGGFVPVGETK